jgi:hypothetical protein
MKERKLRHLDTVKFRLHALRLRQQVPVAVIILIDMRNSVIAFAVQKV